MPSYADPEVRDLSESTTAPHGEDTSRRMYQGMSARGEVYIIEVRDALGSWLPVGVTDLQADLDPGG